MIAVKKEPLPNKGPAGYVDDRERCCFCRERTEFWFVKKDVACCTSCAAFADESDVPDKSTWIRRETIARR